MNTEQKAATDYAFHKHGMAQGTSRPIEAEESFLAGIEWARANPPQVTEDVRGKSRGNTNSGQPTVPLHLIPPPPRPTASNDVAEQLASLQDRYKEKVAEIATLHAQTAADQIRLFDLSKQIAGMRDGIAEVIDYMEIHRMGDADCTAIAKILERMRRKETGR